MIVDKLLVCPNRFDEKRQGEPAIALKGKKHHYRENFAHDQDEMKAQIRFVADKAEKKVQPFLPYYSS